jgi:hypothetical protein
MEILGHSRIAITLEIYTGADGAPSPRGYRTAQPAFRGAAWPGRCLGRKVDRRDLVVFAGQAGGVFAGPAPQFEDGVHRRLPERPKSGPVHSPSRVQIVPGFAQFAEVLIPVPGAGVGHAGMLRRLAGAVAPRRTPAVLGLRRCRAGESVDFRRPQDVRGLSVDAIFASPLGRAATTAPGDARPGRDVAQPHARVVGDAQQHPGVIGHEAPVRHAR